MSEARALRAQLPPAPARLAGGDGKPQFGLYAGSVRDASFARLSDAPGILQRRLMEKKWQYVFVATPEMMLALAVIDGGYLSSGICAVFDRGARRMLVNDNPVLPPICAQVGEDPADGMSARLLGPAIRARMQRAEGRVSIQATCAHADVDLMLDRWAFATGRAGSHLVAFNFSDGFLGSEGENVVWIDGEPQPAGPVTFSFDARAPLLDWRVRSADGRVDLTFHPEGYRAQTIDLKLIRSAYLQPFGVWSGSVNGVAIEGLAGVAEDHQARW